MLAIHLAGGGHNDAWIGLLVLGALALAASRRANAAGGVWTLAVAVKWVPLVFLALRLLEARARRERLGLAGLGAATALVGGVATWRYGWRWLTALAPLADNARLETRYAIPHRLQGAGLPRDVALGLAVAVLGAGLACWHDTPRAAAHERLSQAACCS